MAESSTLGNVPRNAEQQARRAAGHARSWVEPLARAGYTAKGVVYVLVGLLASQAAFGSGQATDSEGALSTLVGSSAGRFVLGLVAIGLFGYALWRALCALIDAEGKGHDGSGIVHRIGYALSALLHASLGVEAARLAISGTGGGGGDGAEHWTARALQLPAGQWLVGIAGALTIGFGLYQLKRAFDDHIQKRLDLSPLHHDGAQWAVRFGRFGTAARGVVFALIGWFLIDAARSANAAEAGGLGEALRTLQEAPYGPWVLGLVALGLVAYGLWEFINARYRRINV